MSKRKSFSPEFKRWVVNKMREQEGRASLIALEYDIPMGLLYRWEKKAQISGEALCNIQGSGVDESCKQDAFNVD